MMQHTACISAMSVIARRCTEQTGLRIPRKEQKKKSHPIHSSGKGDAPEYNRCSVGSVESRRQREGVMRLMRHDFKKFQASFFQPWERFLNWLKFNMLSTCPRSVLHPTMLPTCCPRCCVHCAQVCPLPLERTRHLFFFSFLGMPSPVPWPLL